MPISEQSANLAEAARRHAGLIHLETREILCASGPDQESFLQGMLTSDVKLIPEGGGQPTCLLTAKGALVSEGRLMRLHGKLWLDVEPGRLERTRQFLEQFLISEEVELSDATPEWAWLGLHGPRAYDWLAKISDAGVARPNGGSGSGFPVRVAGIELHALGWDRCGLCGVELAMAREHLNTVLQALRESAAGIGGVELDEDSAELLRIEAGRPRFGRELTEQTIPLEAHLQASISYTKGCYIGQEVIARATYRGQVNKELVGLRLSEKAEPLTELLTETAEPKRVGRLTSVVFSPRIQSWIAMGFVQRNHLAEGTALRFGATGHATVCGLPFIHLATDLEE